MTAQPLIRAGSVGRRISAIKARREELEPKRFRVQAKGTLIPSSTICWIRGILADRI